MALLRSDEYEHRQIEQAIEILDRAVENHTKWLQNVHESIICGEPVDEGTTAEDAHKNCKLGKWYYKEESEVFNHYSEFIDLEEPHRIMHDAARELLQKNIESPDLDEYRAFIKKQQQVIQQLQHLKDKLVGTFHSFDSLTGAINRDAFNIIALNEQARIRRENSCCCLVLIDIDHFKDVNDRYGHVTGDHALRAFAQMIKSFIRRSDTFCRFGGEEFVLLLTDTNIEDAAILVDKIRQTIEETDFKISDSLSLKIHFSAGVSQCTPGDELDDCLEDADKKLYKAKQSGRNQIVS